MMKHQKLVATLLGISTLTCSISQTKKKLQSSDNQKNLEEQTKLNATRKPENIKNSNKDEVISIEYPVSQLTNILIDNNNRSLEIRTWSESKVKISAIYSSQGNNINGGNNLLLFEDMNIHTKSIGNSFTIKTGIANKQNSSQNNWGYESDPAIKKTVTIYVPSVNKLSIESKYADITVKNYLKKVSIDITNGSLELDKINSLTLRSKYANVAINEIQSGEIDFINGKLSIQTLGDVELDTKYSTVEIGSIDKLSFKSTNDDYELEDVTVLEGTKNYGNLRISKLSESIQLDGTNTDVKIKNISPSTKSIWIDNKYADLRIPLKSLTDFSLTYDGVYSTIYKKFPVIVDTFSNEKNINSAETDDSKLTTGDISNSKFKALVGTGKSTTIAIKCPNCTVDLK